MLTSLSIAQDVMLLGLESNDLCLVFVDVHGILFAGIAVEVNIMSGLVL